MPEKQREPEVSCRTCGKIFSHPNPAVNVCEECWGKSFDWLSAAPAKPVPPREISLLTEARDYLQRAVDSHAKIDGIYRKLNDFLGKAKSSPPAVAPPCGYCGYLYGHAINCDAPSPVLTPTQITIGVPTIETFNESSPGTMRPEATFVKSERPVLPHDISNFLETVAWNQGCTREYLSELALKLLRASSPNLAQKFHETYERLAPNFGYQTRKESAKPWAEVPENNKRLMIAVCAEILAAPAVAGRTQGDDNAIYKLICQATRTPKVWAFNNLRDFANEIRAALRESASPPAIDVADFYEEWINKNGRSDGWVLRFAVAYAKRESASFHNLSESETKAAKLKLYDLWCQAGSEDFTQWLAEKAIELFAGRESAREAPSDQKENGNGN